MAIIKCKMCGGDIELAAEKTFGTCEFCGNTMTLPKIDDEQRAATFNRGNHFRRTGEFDKALAVYERIVLEDDTDAEAHWCCALCRFGIEYVEDPATLEWLPTCHRASFDSFLEDVDYKAAVEHSDGITRRQYIKDGMKIAEVQRGILATSQNTEPYDVFICYKESDENGNRTRDSLMAQDIYYQLTEQGRKVFFARITLEDVAGTQYEPYIFAALNSAKVMVVVGTRPEHLNAVWVKNEWSRFLSMMKKDRHKLLLPCYVGMDPYDLPEQLSVLQSYDMSKIGFIQDLTRGIEKVLSYNKNTVVVQEQASAAPAAPVVPADGGHKITALLERGKMALEDGDWAKADGFFEEVLNNDPKNSLAYIGKALAQEKCPTIDALVRRRLDLYKNVDAQTKKIQEDTDHIREMAEKFSIPGYVEASRIRKVYEFYRRYTSTVAGRQKQYRDEESWWQNHKLLVRAEQFTNGEATALSKGKKYLFDQLTARIKDAQEAEARNIAELEKAYRIHMAEADKEAEEYYRSAFARREEDYQHLLEKSQKATDPGLLLELAKSFEELGTYQDSQKMAEQCRQQAARKQERRAKLEGRILISLLAVVILAAVTINIIIPAIQYSKAEALLAAGQYDEAFDAFTALGDYQDSAARAQEAADAKQAEIDAQISAENAAAYAAAQELYKSGDYAAARDAFQALGDYRDSEWKAVNAEQKLEEERIAQENAQQYLDAEALLAEGKTAEAAIAFGKLGDYSDARERSLELWDDITQRNSISAGFFHTVGLKADGTVVAVGENGDGQCNVDGWTDIVAIAAGRDHTVGLKADGTVVAVGYNNYGECNVDGWTDIVAISAGYHHTVGLKADGTVVAAGFNSTGQCDVDGWTDIVTIIAGGYHTVGLKTDGTVVAVGYNNYGQCGTYRWANITDIAAGYTHTVCLKADGTVVAVGDNGDGQCSVDDWSDIVAVAAGYYHTVGLKANGTVVAVGSGKSTQCDVGGCTNIVAIAAGYYHTVGLKADGTVVAVGNNACGQCDVDGWQNIRLPD